MSRVLSQLFLRLAGSEARSGIRNLLREAAGPSIADQLRGISGRRGSGFLDSLIRAFVGRHHAQIDEIRRGLGGRMTNYDIARELMRGAGTLDQPATTGRVGRGAGTAGRGAGRGGGGGRGVGTGGLPPEPPEQPGGGQRGNMRPSRVNPGDAPPLPGEESPYGQETLTPQSSNVFSFSYQPRNSTLYVTFKGNVLHGDGVRTGKGRRGGMDQLIGRRGRTVGGKSDTRGPMYAYDGVPARVYQRMQLAQSKGRFVWDELRIRGTIYGHKYPNRLVQGQVVTQTGISGVYIPRKATKQGFRVRSVATIGQGRRRFESSTLPEQIGFRTRRPPGR